MSNLNYNQSLSEFQPYQFNFQIVNIIANYATLFAVFFVIGYSLRLGLGI